MENNYLSIKGIFGLFNRLKWIILVTTGVALLLAFLVIIIYPKKYQQSIWVMYNKSEPSVSNSPYDFGLMGSSNPKLENEVFILQSPTLMTKVVEELHLNNRYYRDCNIFNRQSRIKVLNIIHNEYYRNNPFDFYIDSTAQMQSGLSSVNVQFEHISPELFRFSDVKINGGTVEFPDSKCNYGDTIWIEGIPMKISCLNAKAMEKDSYYSWSWQTPRYATSSFMGGLHVLASTSKNQQGDIVIMDFSDAIVERARDVLNSLISVDNTEAREYSSIAQIKTIEFIDSRLETLAASLGQTEGDYRSYQSSNLVVDLGSQSQAVLSTKNKYQDQLVEIDLRIQLANILLETIQSNENDYDIIPTTIGPLGADDTSVSTEITAYNQMIVDRNRMMQHSSASNPRVIEMNAQLALKKRGLVLYVSNLISVLELRRDELQKSLLENRRQLASIPQQQLNLQSYDRKLDVIVPLFQMLQQQRETAQIAIFSQIDNFRIIESAFGPYDPISPKATTVYIIALMIGLLVAPAFVILKSQLKSKVEDKDDIAMRVDCSVVATITDCKSKYKKIINFEGRNVCAESFRMLRTNLMFIPNNKTIQVTSSVPGEGKSFVSINMAISLSHLNKKVLIIGMDLRNPALARSFNLEETLKKSFVGYLTGVTPDINDVIIPSGINPNLDVILSGPIPPNPLELLACCDFDKLFGYLKQKYDYVIVDSSPYLPVADSSVINPHVDCTLLIVRANYTDLSVLDELNEKITDEKMPVKNAYIVLNGVIVPSNQKNYGYGSYYGYSYGEDPQD